MTAKWYGDDVKRAVYQATAWGINKIVSESIQYALDNHPGWKYRTGVAERSISQKKFSEVRKTGVTPAVWGSLWSKMPEKVIDKVTGNPITITTNYVFFLEKYHGHFLQHSADINYPKLNDRIKSKFKTLRTGK